MLPCSRRHEAFNSFATPALITVEWPKRKKERGGCFLKAEGKWEQGAAKKGWIHAGFSALTASSAGKKKK